MRTITTNGRGYPTPAAAKERLRSMLERDGVEAKEIRARRWTEKPVICPWEAVAEVSDEDAKKLGL